MSDHIHWMPCKPGETPRPAPTIMSQEDAIEFLGMKDGNKPLESLNYWRRIGKLRGAYVSLGRHSYLLTDLIEFIKNKSQEAPIVVKPPSKAFGKNRERRIPKL